MILFTGHSICEEGTQDAPGWKLSVGPGMHARNFIPEKRALAREGVVYMTQLDQFGIILCDDRSQVLDGVVGRIDLQDPGYIQMKKKLRSDRTLVFLRAFFTVKVS